MTLAQLFEWCVLLAFLLFVVKAAVAIKNEKNTYLSDGVLIDFQKFEILVPRWWTITYQSSDKMCFERTDTRYDWKATFERLRCPPSKELVEHFCQIMQEKHIEFDQDTSIIHSPELLTNLKLLAANEIQAIRVEGTATENLSERLYYDALVLFDSKRNETYLFESRSSILNGLLEGPYFEEAIKNIKISSS